MNIVKSSLGFLWFMLAIFLDKFLVLPIIEIFGDVLGEGWVYTLAISGTFLMALIFTFVIPIYLLISE